MMTIDRCRSVKRINRNGGDPAPGEASTEIRCVHRAGHSGHCEGSYQVCGAMVGVSWKMSAEMLTRYVLGFVFDSTLTVNPPPPGPVGLIINSDPDYDTYG
jgi:hypothetical protein